MALTDTVEYKLDRGLSEARRAGHRFARDARSAARDLNGEVKDNMRSLVDELDALLKEDVDADALRKRLRGRLEAARDTLDDASWHASRRLRRSAERVTQAVHDNPWQAAGIVAGLAFAAGILLARR
ncbi:DUF883 family protein [Burkholderia thailandensis]|uniref:DUF883 domain-containing protein n=2 Tax=Burkholderia thailandensis TaxID=57975 RepID=A0AAW9CMV3_BURTH|nr:DUF883 family protein [Burkholderia thailandensis]ABC35400.1 Bacterial protein of unknown function (DUF883) family [Burkholderia thailandensis E264]AHI66974.1 hypothetical protein BTL_5651 [Burkholderia thailandensis H0587]AHI77064.1 hypothetical protein BTQ_3825 [Burkholderia thailandensis 2002721723]AHI80828.1 hypothetical protein BTJ_4857 [Burkholderia thailandensis E444]AIC89304.1 hypothetical protein BTRA_5585 [Burkholderia thailandensis USAMRU Malaysia \